MSIERATPGTPVAATDVRATAGTTYPPAFKAHIEARIKRRLGDAFGLQQFGINLVVLPRPAPGRPSVTGMPRRTSSSTSFPVNWSW